MSNQTKGAPRARVNFKASIDNAVRARHGRVEKDQDRMRDGSTTSGEFSYACAVITKRHNGLESPRNNPFFANKPNGFGRHAKKRKWLAKAHR